MFGFATHKLWVFHRLNAFKLTVMLCYNHTSSMISVNDEKYNQLLRYMPSLTPWVWDSRIFAPSHAKKKNTKMCHFKSEKTEKTEENEVFYVWKRYRCVIYIYILYIYIHISLEPSTKLGLSASSHLFNFLELFHIAGITHS